MLILMVNETYYFNNLKETLNVTGLTFSGRIRRYREVVLTQFIQVSVQIKKVQCILIVLIIVVSVSDNLGPGKISHNPTVIR